MNNGYKVLIGIVSLTCITGIGANANKIGAIATNDTTKVAQTVSPSTAHNTVDEVIWVVGDEPILKSDVEAMRLQGDADGVKWKGDPDCSIPEQIAVQKLYMHQAAIDSISVSESEISQGIDDQINYWISLVGSKEKLEEYRKQPVSIMRQEMHDDFKNRQLVQKMKESLVKDIAVTPADVRNYFRTLPADSVPSVPTTVEVAIITQQPKPSQDEINRVKDKLREYTDRVNKGDVDFATLARLYSEDTGSARQGGEIGYAGRGTLAPEFANVAFNLTDPKKVSKIVETDFGYHIIQLIDKRGDRVNVRHILLKPHISDDEIDKAKLKLDSIKTDITNGKFTFENAASVLSDDKDTKNNQGLMAYTNQETRTRTAKFQLKNLPPEIAHVVDTLKVNEISAPFQMTNDKGKTICAIIKLKDKEDEHKATITEDFQTMKEIVLAKERDKKLHDWVMNAIKHTYVRMDDRYKNCNFEYQGWIK